MQPAALAAGCIAKGELEVMGIGWAFPSNRIHEITFLEFLLKVIE